MKICIEINGRTVKLTSIKMRIWTILADGLSAKKIAKKISRSYSYRTVEKHIEQLKAKTHIAFDEILYQLHI